MMKILSTQDHEAEDKNKTCSLQHAWKTYTSSNKDHNFKPIPSITIGSSGTEGEIYSSDSLELMDQSRLDLGHIPESESSNDSNLLSTQCGCESETESIMSDYSEMADPVKEHLANVQIMADPLSSASFIVRPRLIRGAEESEAAFLQRIRKMNFLSLAQEFADLKKQNASILPFNLHEERYKNGKESEDEADKVDELSTGSLSIDGSEGKKDSEWREEEASDVLNSLTRTTVLADSNLSHCCRRHVSTLEECHTSEDVSPGFRNPDYVSADACSGFCPDNSSTLSAEKSNPEEEMFTFCVQQDTSPLNHTLRCSTCGGRDDVCRKLAMTDDDEFLIDREGDCDLELCYVNEAAEDLDLDLCGLCFDGIGPEGLSSDHDLEMGDRGHEVEEDILSRQAFFEMKTRLALAQVRPRIDQQLKSEVQSTKSTFLNLEKLPGWVTDSSRPQNRQKLEKMTVTELQIIANDLCERIEALNHQLVADLLQRDDLHMVQDSMLVEIEDLTGRAKEYASKVDGRRQNKPHIHFK